MATADLSGDGFPDVIVGVVSGLAVLLNRGDGTLGFPIVYGVGSSSPTAILVADFNEDGHPDIAVLAGATAQILLNRGNGFFASAVQYDLSGGRGDSAVPGDFNHDGHMDLANGFIHFTPIILAALGRTLCRDPSGKACSEWRPIMQAGTIEEWRLG